MKQKNPALRQSAGPSRFSKWRLTVGRDFKTNKGIYALAVPGILFYIIFCYFPMYGLVIAFKNYSPGLGILGSPWVGLTHFVNFFTGPQFGRLLANTLLLSFYLILFTFPAPIILALMLNEVRGKWFKKSVQTITYLPHFISLVVICGIIVDFCSTKGILTSLLNSLGGTHINLLQESGLFRSIYVISDIWQGVGWGSIIYLAAMSGLDMELYEAAEMDGAGKIRQLVHVTLPGLMPTIIIMFILRIGNIMTIGADKVILLYSPVIYEKADIISSYIYRKGLVENNQSFSAAVGLFNSLINCGLVFGANWFSRRFGESSLW